MLYLTEGTEPAGRSNNPIRNRLAEEEVVMRKENREELPLPPLYDGAGEEIPRSKLPSWHMPTPTPTLRPTWGRTQGDEHIYIPQHTPLRSTGDGHDRAESSTQGQSNTKVMELLHLVRKEMEDRNKQLKLQLQWRDENIDKELSRRDKFWE